MNKRITLLLAGILVFISSYAQAADDLVRSAGLSSPSAKSQPSLLPHLSEEQAARLSEQLSGVLTLEDCIRIALENSPSAVSAQLGIQEAHIQLNLARGEFLPTASAGASQNYTVSNPAGGSTSDHGNSNVYAQAQLAISGITDKVRAVKIQQLAVEQAQQTLDGQINSITRNVKRAYYALLSAVKTVDIRLKSRDLYQQQYDRASEFYSEGLRPKVDVTTAEVNLNNEKLRLIRAQNAVKTASANLASVMGVTTPNPLQVADVDLMEAVDIPFDQAVQTAYKNRPDVLSAQTNAKIGQIRVNQAKAGYLPTLSFSAGFTKYDNNFALDNEETKLMVSLDVPIFSAFKTYNGVKQARVNLAKINNNNRSLFNDVFLEVQNAYIAMQEAEQSVPIAELNVEKAKENLDLAQGRYNEGIGDVIELKDAEVAYTDAELSLLTARYDYASAVADLKQAMGTN
ncbi:MAG: TolC family protein [Elusimicrobiaceae bacterium]|nr:TolC family protein [Elusimicrobiaceae bacterium]